MTATLAARELPGLARWLSGAFPQLPEEFDSGRQELIRAVAGHLECSTDEANTVLCDMERAGYLRYAAESRSIGGSPGTWVIYPSPGENPDVLDDPTLSS
jgi:hypothetical protein